MIPALQGRFDQLEARRVVLFHELGTLAAEQLAFRPAPAAWSQAEVAHHLSLVEARVTRVLTERRVTGVARRRMRDVLIFAPALRIYFAIGGRAKMPVKGVAPDRSVPLERTAAQWAESRRALAAYLDALDGAAGRAIVYRHPIAGFMDIGGTLQFLARHHDHHLRQVARIRAAPGYPATARGAARTA